MAHTGRRKVQGLAPLQEMIMPESRERPNHLQGDGGCMSIANNTTESSDVTPKAAVEAWDQVVRVLNWTLLAYFILALATGGEANRVHVALGCTIAIHLALRMAWGLIAQYHAQSRNLVGPPRHQVPPYLRDAERRAVPRHFRHHPVGAAMIGAFLTTLGCICVTGVMMTTDAFWEARWLQDLHATLASVAVGLVVLYALGALVTSLGNRESLVKTGDRGTKAALTAKRRIRRAVANGWGR
jgi:cytochrome b